MNDDFFGSDTLRINKEDPRVSISLFLHLDFGFDT